MKLKQRLKQSEEQTLSLGAAGCGCEPRGGHWLVRQESEARQDTGQEWWAWGRSHSTLGLVVRGGDLGFSGGHSKSLEVLNRRMT